MSLRQRFPTAMILLGILFVVVQYAPPIVTLLALQALILVSLLEFYGLAAKAGLRPRAAVGIVITALLAASAYLPVLSAFVGPLHRPRLHGPFLCPRCP